MSLELGNLLRWAASRLEEAGVPSPRVDAELLAVHVLGSSRGEIQAAAVTGRTVPEQAIARIEDLVTERARRVPLQHLTGVAPFRTLELRVGPGVFIPRPETEQVVQAVLDRLSQHGPAQPRIADLGTGSGAIAAAIAAEWPTAEVDAVERCATAAAWAELNLSSKNITLHTQDLRTLPNEWTGSFDIVVSNPPYIPAEAVPKDIEVRVHDPQSALYGGGADGLKLPRAVIDTAKRILRPGGWLIVEHAEAQAESLRRVCEEDPLLAEVNSHPDLSGRPRATSALRSSGPTPVGEYSP